MSRLPDRNISRDFTNPFVTFGDATEEDEVRRPSPEGFAERGPIIVVECFGQTFEAVIKIVEEEDSAFDIEAEKLIAIECFDEFIFPITFSHILELPEAQSTQAEDNAEAR